MDNIKIAEYKRNCLLGAVGALLMVVGDLSLSMVKADSSDEGLYIREAYRKLCLDKEKITVQNAQMQLYKMLKNAKYVNKCEKAFDIY